MKRSVLVNNATWLDEIELTTVTKSNRPGTENLSSDGAVELDVPDPHVHIHQMYAANLGVKPIPNFCLIIYDDGTIETYDGCYLSNTERLPSGYLDPHERPEIHGVRYTIIYKHFTVASRGNES